MKRGSGVPLNTTGQWVLVWMGNSDGISGPPPVHVPNPVLIPKMSLHPYPCILPTGPSIRVY